MPLGSVACTVMLSFASARCAMVCSICGAVLSVATDWIVTVMGDVCATRLPESTAKPTTVKNVLGGVPLPVTSTESMKFGVAGDGGDPLGIEPAVRAGTRAGPATSH